MALSGSFNTNTFTDPDGDYKYLQFSWTATQSTANNQSTINWTLTSYGNSNWQYAGPFTVVIDGETVYYSTARIQLRNGTKIASGTKVLAHSDTGGKSFTASVSAAIYYSSINTTGSGNFTLDTINRKSIVAASNGTLGTAQTLTVTRYNSSFTHTITYSCGTASGTICTKSSATSLSFTPPIDLASQAPSNTTVSVKLTITTYNGNTSLGANSIDINCSIPSSVVPSVSIAVSDPSGYAATYGKYIQGKSQLQIDITAEGIYGSTIKTYNTTAQGKSYSGESVYIDLITEAADFEVNTTVKDSRDRPNSDKEAIPVYAYSNPVISAISVQRCTANGTLNSSGEYLKLTFDAVVTSLGDQNTVKYEVQYKKKKDTDYSTPEEITAYSNNYAVTGGVFVFAADTSSSYDITLIATDAFGSVPAYGTGASIKKFWSWLYNGLGFALGKIAEKEYLFDSAWAINSDVGYKLGGRDMEYVVEQGTSEGWVYRKWNSGIAECWGVFGHTEGSADYIQFDIPYPFAFIETPVVVVSADGQGGYAKTISPYNNTKSTTLARIAYKNSSSSSVFSQFNIHVIGKWK